MPPAMRTRPLTSRVAVVPPWAGVIEPVELKVPVFGSYSSAEARSGALSPTSPPPAIRTRPLDSNVAVWPTRPTCNEPVGLKVPLFGSYSSADDRAVSAPPPSVMPPLMRTRPLGSRVAVCPWRPVTNEPVATNPETRVGEEAGLGFGLSVGVGVGVGAGDRSEEHTSELQSR